MGRIAFVQGFWVLAFGCAAVDRPPEIQHASAPAPPIQYRLPFDSSVPRKLAQGVAGESPVRRVLPGGFARIGGNTAIGSRSHRGRHKYAFDFLMPVGTKILAARAGVIGRGGVLGVRVRHVDGSYAVYGHASEVLVEAGRRVETGDLIARSGGAGESAPHLHFSVMRVDEAGVYRSIPIHFADGTREGYVPVAGLYYGGREVRKPKNR